MTEDQLEQETLAWLQDVGYTHVYGPDMAPDGRSPERENFRQVLLTGRLRAAGRLGRAGGQRLAGSRPVFYPWPKAHAPAGHYFVCQRLAPDAEPQPAELAA